MYIKCLRIHINPPKPPNTLIQYNFLVPQTMRALYFKEK